MFFLFSEDVANCPPPPMYIINVLLTINLTGLFAGHPAVPEDVSEVRALRRRGDFTMSACWLSDFVKIVS